MARQEINIGVAPTGAGGDTTRGGAVKINAMTSEIYTKLASLKSASLADILGLVSQAGGVPVGAIMESGSNANGLYTKFADGTMICRVSFSNIVVMEANQIKDFGTANLPASFINSNYSVLATAVPTTSFDTYGFTTSYAVSPNVFRTVYRNGAVAQSLSGIQVTCIGRWF